MLIPIRCFTCGKVIADKYEYYLKEVEKLQKGEFPTESKKEPEQNKAKDKGKGKEQITPEYKQFESLHTGPILDKLGLNRYCCRRHMIATVDMMDTI
jgi:DNA-directed RNA polymerase subunit N (RpoN/RPB10)